MTSGMNFGHDWGYSSGSPCGERTADTKLQAVLEQRCSRLAVCNEVMRHPKVFTTEGTIPHSQHVKVAHSKNLFIS